MFELIIWVVCIYILAKMLGAILQVIRPFFEPPRKQEPNVREKETRHQFDNVQDADFEDITDKK
jgi:hypothetical protein